MEIDYDAEIQKMLRLLEEAKKAALNWVPLEEISRPKKLSELKVEAMSQKVITVPIEEDDFDDDVLVPEIKLPKPERKREKELKIEVASSIEEKEKPVDMLFLLDDMKSHFQEVEIKQIEEEPVQEESIDVLFSQLDEIKDEVSSIKPKPVFIEKEMPVKKASQPKKPKDIPIALQLQEKVIGEKVEAPSKDFIKEFNEIEKEKVAPPIAPSSPAPILPKAEPEPILKISSEPLELINEAVQISIATKELKEIHFDENMILDNAKKIIQILKKAPLTLYAISELTDLIEIELYQAIEFLKDNELLNITRKDAEDLFELPEISIQRWEKFVLEEKKEEASKPKVTYSDPEEIYTGLQPHCPYCNVIIDLREIKLLFKGYEPECPKCRTVLKPSDIGM